MAHRHDRILALALLALLSLFPSCSLFVPSMQAVSINTNVSDAEIFVDGARVGTGSASIELRRNKSHSVMAKAGEKTAAAGIGTKSSTTGILDIIGGFFFLIPLIGLAGPGFWDLEPEAINLNL